SQDDIGCAVFPAIYRILAGRKADAARDDHDCTAGEQARYAGDRVRMTGMGVNYVDFVFIDRFRQFPRGKEIRFGPERKFDAVEIRAAVIGGHKSTSGPARNPEFVAFLEGGVNEPTGLLLSPPPA